MTNTQKIICRELLQLSYDNGFGCAYPLKPILEKHKIVGDIYNQDTETGLLWAFGSFGNGMLNITNNKNGIFASIAPDQRDLLASWCNFNY